MQQQYLVDEYSPPGGTCDVEKSPKPVIYLWGGGVTTPMILDLPTELVDSKAEAVVCGRMQRMAVTDDGKVISWKASHMIAWLLLVSALIRERERVRESLCHVVTRMKYSGMVHRVWEGGEGFAK